MFWALLTGIVTAANLMLVEKKEDALILVLSAAAALILMNSPLGVLGIGVAVLSPRIKKYALFSQANLLSAVLVSSSLLWYYEHGLLPGTRQTAVIFALAVAAVAIYGILEPKLYRFLALSNLAQLGFVALDLSVAFALGNPGILKTVQVFNYAIAGSLLFLGIGMVARKKEYVSDLTGSWFVSKWADLFAVIACLSLAGLPGFNMFVSEWALFTKGFELSPSITLLGIFLAMILFIMYYKIAYYLLVGPGRKKKSDRLRLAFAGTLAVIVILLGIVPGIQETVLGWLV